MCAIGQLKGQLTRHARVSGQNASCTAVLHFAELTVAFFFFFLFLMKTYNHNRSLVSFSNFVTTTDRIGLRSVLFGC